MELATFIFLRKPVDKKSRAFFAFVVLEEAQVNNPSHFEGYS